MPKRRPQPKHTNAYDLTISYATSHKCGTKGIKQIYKQNQQFFSIHSFDPIALEDETIVDSDGKEINVAFSNRRSTPKSKQAVTTTYQLSCLVFIYLCFVFNYYATLGMFRLAILCLCWLGFDMNFKQWSDILNGLRFQFGLLYNWTIAFYVMASISSLQQYIMVLMIILYFIQSDL